MFKLNIGKKCLDRVLSGEQKEVYQIDIPVNEESLTNVWGKDLSAWKNPQRVTLTESEEEDARFALAVCTLARGEGWPEWGAEKGVIYFILKIQRLEASCEVVAEEEKAEDPIAEDKVEEVPEVVAEPEPVVEAEPEEEKKAEVTVEDVKKAADELAKAAAEAGVATGEATKAIEKAGQVIAETVPVVGAVKAEEEPVAKEPAEEKKAEEKTETEVKKEKAEVNE